MSDKELKPLIKSFIAELNLLSNKYGVVVGGCQCCGSPWVMLDNTKGQYSYDIDAQGSIDNLIWEEKDK